MGLVALAAQDSSVQASQQVPDIAETRAVADRYCVTCHNPRTSAGHLDLTSVDFARPGEHAAVFEKVIAKLRAGLMPPAGQRQPNADERTDLVTYLETHLDAAPEAVLQVAASTPPGSMAEGHGAHGPVWPERCLVGGDADGETCSETADVATGGCHCAGTGECLHPTDREGEWRDLRILGAALQGSAEVDALYGV